MLDTGDTAFVLVSSAMVMLMTPGLALFYGGMVRAKNVLSMLLQNFFLLGVASVVWALVGYSLAFGTDAFGGLIGNLDHIGLTGVGQEPTEGSTIPHLAFMIFQAMFAIITPALVTGALAERAKFGALMLFFVIWQIFIYSPAAHWVWGPDGWIGSKLGALDFAGGTVVHILSASTAAALIVIVGPRIGNQEQAMPPHSLPLTVLGAGLLWFGWFGFNAGSALAANGLAASAFVVTHLAAAAATVAWVAAEWLHQGRPTMLGGASGCIAGLVAITPAAGFVGPMPALIIGLLAGLACYGGILLKNKLGYDDSLDVIGIHGIGGTLGAILTGVFATTAVNPDGADGLFSGNPGLVGAQIVAVLATIAFGFLGSLVLGFIVHKTIGLRVSPDHEIIGLDKTEHAESGYDML
ncbi:MAG: ammonium transporter [Armatimonadia bacterium]|jgi:Amt family ammonium transporter|nr:ammonium transporter [Armatimonadia bacterium]